MADMVGQAQNVQVPNYSGVNIQIFNPSVAAPGASVPASTVNAANYSTNPSYPASYYTQNLAQPTTPAPVQSAPAQVPEKKKTEKREVVQLTDDYVKTLEGYLNNQNKDVRLMGAKEVLARLQEDDSRKNDPALNALVNKMLQDPSQPVKFIAMAALESRLATGNDTSVKLLKDIQKQKTGYGEDSLKASNILLKMSGNPMQKEFEVKEKPEKETKKE
ncbi:MAG: hypothetical protein WCY19_00295 [Candidatus Gastranaerophilaceae bacterium]